MDWFASLGAASVWACACAGGVLEGHACGKHVQLALLVKRHPSPTLAFSIPLSLFRPETLDKQLVRHELGKVLLKCGRAPATQAEPQIDPSIQSLLMNDRRWWRCQASVSVYTAAGCHTEFTPPPLSGITFSFTMQVVVDVKDKVVKVFSANRLSAPLVWNLLSLFPPPVMHINNVHQLQDTEVGSSGLILGILATWQLLLECKKLTWGAFL